MSNLVGQFLDETKVGLNALAEDNPELAKAVMTALVALAQYEATVPQRISNAQEAELQGAIAEAVLTEITLPKQTMQVLSEEQQRALENRAYSGTPESTTEDDDIDAITAALNEIDVDEVLAGLDLDNLEDDVDDLLAMFDEDEDEDEEDED